MVIMETLVQLGLDKSAFYRYVCLTLLSLSRLDIGIYLDFFQNDYFTLLTIRTLILRLSWYC